MPCRSLRANLIQGCGGEPPMHSSELPSSGVSDKTMVFISRRGYRSLRGFSYRRERRLRSARPRSPRSLETSGKDVASASRPRSAALMLFPLIFK